MRNYVKSMISLSLVLMILFSGLIPVLALDDTYTGEIVGAWDQYLYSSLRNSVSLNVDLGLWQLELDNPLAGFNQWLAGGLSNAPWGGHGTVCSVSEDALHHAEGLVDNQPHYDQDGKLYALARCSYCGANFNVYGSDLQQSYEAQVAELPATSYSSDGSLLYALPTLDYFLVGAFNGHQQWEGCPHTPSDISDGTGSALNSAQRFFDCSTGTIQYIPESGHGTLYADACRYHFSGKAPVSGYYTLQAGPGISLECILLDGSKSVSSWNYTQASSATYYSVSADIVCTIKSNSKSTNISYAIATCSHPVYKIVPFDFSGTSTTYSITSRPTSITGDYGIIGDNGQIIKVEGDKIVNETNNTYYNPATGTTDTITDWSYNYEDRSYTLTLGGGTTTTVTYGDENVTIKEGDTTYNIYYLINGSGSENPDPGTDPDVPPTCDHTWTETSRTDPTCTTPGKVISTCSKCNQSKTETIPATGHSWVVDRTVQTTYDEEGNLLQQGYTIYSCSVCGEQYKDMEGTGPPADDDPGDGGIIEFLDGLIKSLSKNLHGAVELILSFFQEIPAMFDGFLAFLTAMFPFLPPEIMTLLAFGIAAVVFIGIIKALRR